MLCDFEDLETGSSATEHDFRCRRCGVVRRGSADQPLRRGCEASIEIDELPAVLPSGDHGWGDRGLGDTVARALARLGFRKRDGCGCPRRQQWLNRLWPYSAARPSRASFRFSFPHGLGDTVQLTIVLRHLRELRPEWRVEIAARPGAASVLEGLGYPVSVLDDGAKDSPPALPWPEPEACYDDSPSTKAERSLREFFGLTPRTELCRYEIRTRRRDRRAARAYLRTLARPRSDGKFPVVALHYQGNSSARAKDLDERLVAQLVAQIERAGHVPLILDWDRRSALLDRPGAANPGAGHALWEGHAVGDGRRLAALIESCALFLGIDSGPGHVAGATSTPSIVVWRGHHPLNYFALADNVTHLLPIDHERLLRGDGAHGAAYFERRYSHRVYQTLREALPRLVSERLEPPGPLMADGDVWVRRACRAADMTIVRDVVHGDCYGVAGWREPARRVLDVGAHIGAFAWRVRQVFPAAEIACVDPDPAHSEAWRRNVGDFARRIEAACTLLPAATLRSSVSPGTPNSGASRIEPVESGGAGRAVVTRTLGQVLDELGWSDCDALKLDCEGCELDALADREGLRRCRLIVGEWHDRARFLAAARRLEPGWRLVVLREGELGLFRLERAEP